MPRRRRVVGASHGRKLPGTTLDEWGIGKGGLEDQAGAGEAAGGAQLGGRAAVHWKGPDRGVGAAVVASLARGHGGESVEGEEGAVG